MNVVYVQPLTSLPSWEYNSRSFLVDDSLDSKLDIRIFLLDDGHTTYDFYLNIYIYFNLFYFTSTDINFFSYAGNALLLFILYSRC